MQPSTHVTQTLSGLQETLRQAEDGTACQGDQEALDQFMNDCQDLLEGVGDLLITVGLVFSYPVVIPLLQATIQHFQEIMALQNQGV